MAYEGYGGYEAAGGERYSTGPSQIPPTGHTGYTDWPYYVVAEGIQHEVIQTDIGRWLGNDAVVRRHTFQGVEVYIYKAYRQLTNAMITSLKDDTRKWTTERELAYPNRGPDFHTSRTFFDRLKQEQPPEPERSSGRRVGGPPPDQPYMDGHPPTDSSYHTRPSRGTSGRGERSHRESGSRRQPPPPRDPRYAYDDDGNPYYDLLTRQYITTGNADVPRTFNQEPAAPAAPPAPGYGDPTYGDPNAPAPRYYTGAPPPGAHFAHAPRPYEGAPSDEE